MKRRIRIKNRLQQQRRHFRLQMDCTVLECRHPDLTLEYDQRAGLAASHLRHSRNGLPDRLFLHIGMMRKRFAAKLRERTPQLRLKNHHQRHRRDRPEILQQPVEHFKLQHICQQSEKNQDDHASGQHTGSAGPAQKIQQTIDQNGNHPEVKVRSDQIINMQYVFQNRRHCLSFSPLNPMRFSEYTSPCLKLQ